MKDKSKLKFKSKIENEEILTLKSQLARALADYDNLTKRADKEREMVSYQITKQLVVKLLPVLDTLRLAQNHLEDAGLAISINEFEETLKSFGVEEIKVKAGDVFNEDYCEVVDLEVGEGKGEKAKISDVLLTGWKFIDGSVLRHAKVKVVK